MDTNWRAAFSQNQLLAVSLFSTWSIFAPKLQSLCFPLPFIRLGVCQRLRSPNVILQEKALLQLIRQAGLNNLLGVRGVVLKSLGLFYCLGHSSSCCLIYISGGGVGGDAVGGGCRSST